jgi:hypothetical protein
LNFKQKSPFVVENYPKLGLDERIVVPFKGTPATLIEEPGGGFLDLRSNVLRL